MTHIISNNVHFASDMVKATIILLALLYINSLYITRWLIVFKQRSQCKRIMQHLHICIPCIVFKCLFGKQQNYFERRNHNFHFTSFANIMTLLPFNCSRNVKMKFQNVCKCLLTYDTSDIYGGVPLFMIHTLIYLPFIQASVICDTLNGYRINILLWMYNYIIHLSSDHMPTTIPCSRMD